MAAKLDTVRMRAAQAASKAARLELEAAAASGDRTRLFEAGIKLAQAQEEERLAKADAEARRSEGRRNSRKDRAPSLEQIRNRQALQLRLGLTDDLVVAPEPSVRIPMGVAVAPWVQQSLKLWEQHCAVLGASSMGRWMMVAGLLHAGKPPGWEGEWPPKQDGET